MRNGTGPDPQPVSWTQAPGADEPRPMFATGDQGDASIRPFQPPSLSEEKLRAAERAAYQRGQADGQRAGAEAAGQQAQALVQRLTQALQGLETVRRETLRRTERDIVRLALAMAERILGERLEEDRPRLLALARTAIDRAGRPVDATIRLHPSDHALATRNGHQPATPGVAVVADPAVPKGGCHIRSTFGDIDAGVSTQIAEMAHILLGDDPPAAALEPPRRDEAPDADDA